MLDEETRVRVLEKWKKILDIIRPSFYCTLTLLEGDTSRALHSLTVRGDALRGDTIVI